MLWRRGVSGEEADRSGVLVRLSGSTNASVHAGRCAMTPRRMSSTERTRRTCPLPHTTTGSVSGACSVIVKVLGVGDGSQRMYGNGFMQFWVS